MSRMSSLTPRPHPALRGAALVLGVLYVVVLALIAFWPTPVDRDASGTITAVLSRLHAHGVPRWVNYPLVEFSANIALFVPVGLLGVLLLGRGRWWMAVLAGFAASCAIELGQFVFLPARYATVVDVIANTSGAAGGAVLALGLLGVLAGRSRVTPARPPVQTGRAGL